MIELPLTKEEFLGQIKLYLIDEYNMSEEDAEDYKNSGGWDNYFNDGYHPKEAVDEDMFYSAQN